MTTWVSFEASSSPVKPTDENSLANTLKLGSNNSHRNKYTVFYMHSYLYQWFLLVLWILITHGTFLSAERTSFFAYDGMLNNVPQVCGAPEWGSDTAYSKQENHLTCNRRPGKSDSYMGLDKLTHIPGNLEGWCMLKKDQRGPQLSTHLWLNMRPENESWGILVNYLITECVSS